ncbi:major facilitator superfamily domain-containing protein [Gigaspora rosea]|uniref:Major facilitator superfamily domain-containing protein n=1 Tax=Gigaspora rosea TaxID=44941 RepID=A0A397U2K5_9GLOM|nr:major facilitator superfamily domain-containing protein [Gigaspora rosea]
MTLKERTEKGITDYEITSTTNQDAASYDSYTFKVMEKRVLRKFDIFILPLCTLLYLFMLVDRSNISNAIAAGFTDQYLQSSSIGFNVAVSAHLIGYVLFEIPSSLVSKVLGFHVWIPIIMVIWAGISMSQAAVTTAVQLGIVRFLLGAAEAGFSPAVIDYICLFYARKEITLRYGIFMALAIISGAFTGLLAYGILQIKGAALKGFQIIFLIEGIPTVVLAIIVAIFFTRGPGDARFLTLDERTFTIERLRPEGGVDEKDTSVMKSQAKSAFYDPRVYGYIIAATAGSILNNVLNYFLPTLVKQLGYSSVDAQLMSVPPFLIATVVMLTISWLSDKYQVRAVPLLIADIITIIRTAGMLGTSANDPSLFKLRYFFIILLACGIYSAQVIIYSWITGNVVGQYKRNITIATGFTFGNIGGVIGILLFPLNLAPSFTTGTIVCLSMMILQFVIALIMKFHLEYENKRRDLATLSKHNFQLSKSELKNTKLIREKAAKLVEHEPKFDEILCDTHPNWRYIV